MLRRRGLGNIAMTGAAKHVMQKQPMLGKKLVRWGAVKHALICRARAAIAMACDELELMLPLKIDL